jgi:hypothetical protein
MISLDKVASAYSGKVGCICGCNGDYAYPSDWVDQAGKDRGYALRAEEVSDRLVKNRVNRLNKMIANKDYDKFDEYDFGVFLEKNGRTVAVYFKQQN